MSTQFIFTILTKFPCSQPLCLISHYFNCNRFQHFYLLEPNLTTFYPPPSPPCPLSYTCKLPPPLSSPYQPLSLLQNKTKTTTKQTKKPKGKQTATPPTKNTHGLRLAWFPRPLPFFMGDVAMTNGSQLKPV